MTFDIKWGGLHTVISGGQTGADQGGLLAAWRSNVQTGGVAASLYKTSIGHNPILKVLGLSHEGDYTFRTVKNVQNSDGTVLIAHNLQSAGTRLTRSLCSKYKRPYLDIDISDLLRIARLGPENGTDSALAEIVRHGESLKDFVIKNQIQTLNVAGNRELKGDGEQYGTMLVTSAADWIVGLAIELLDLEGLVTYKSPT